MAERASGNPVMRLQTTFRISPPLGRITLLEAGDKQHQQVTGNFFMSRFQQVIRDLGQRDRARLGVDAIDSMPRYLAKLERQLGNRGFFGITHSSSFILVARLFTLRALQAKAACSTQHSSLQSREATGVASTSTTFGYLSYRDSFADTRLYRALKDHRAGVGA